MLEHMKLRKIDFGDKMNYIGAAQIGTYIIKWLSLFSATYAFGDK